MPTARTAWHAEGPFDRIVVVGRVRGAAARFVDQISSGGVLIAPIGPAEGEQAGRS
jgi:protein-L-isoaspartate(D-aspartate) O-methyltransferase